MISFFSLSIQIHHLMLSLVFEGLGSVLIANPPIVFPDAIIGVFLGAFSVHVY